MACSHEWPEGGDCSAAAPGEHGEWCCACLRAALETAERERDTLARALYDGWRVEVHCGPSIQPQRRTRYTDVPDEDGEWFDATDIGEPAKYLPAPVHREIGTRIVVHAFTRDSFFILRGDHRKGAQITHFVGDDCPGGHRGDDGK